MVCPSCMVGTVLTMSVSGGERTTTVLWCDYCGHAYRIEYDPGRRLPVQFYEWRQRANPTS